MRQQSAITPGIHAIKVSSGELLTHWTWEHVHMSVVGAAMSDYVEPDATDQGSLREFMRWTSEGYVMIHIAQGVGMHF